MVKAKLLKTIKTQWYDTYLKHRKKKIILNKLLNYI